MPDESYQDVNLPCLLDRLTDEKPGDKKEGRSARSIGVREYRRSVFRDLDWLLNTTRTLDEDDLEHYPNVKHSVLNYGIPNVPGLCLSGSDQGRIEAEILESVRVFEPRFMSGSVRVDTVSNADEMNHRALVIGISAELWSDPYPEDLYIKTSFDLENETAAIVEGSAHG